MLSEKQQKAVVDVYKDTAKAEKEEIVVELAEEFDTSKMEIRQTLQDAKVYDTGKDKTEKEQYAAALYAITLVPEKEWMKLTLRSKKKIMEVFKGSNHG